MAIETPNIDEISFKSFESTIKNCVEILEKKIRTEKNPIKVNKYKKAQNVYNAGLEKYEKTIEMCKKLEMTTDGDKKVNFYTDVIEKRNASINLATVQYEMNKWIEKNQGEGYSLTDEAKKKSEKFSDADLSVDVIDVHYNPVDRCKKAGKDILEGKGISKGLMTTAAVAGIGDILCKGVSSMLVKEGIISQTYNLIGLGKLGIQNLPALGNLIAGGLKTFAEFSSLGLAGGAVVLGLSAIPVVKGVVDKVKAKYKNSIKVEQDLAEALNKGQVQLAEE